jgi:predicted nuclease of restriction endonuclease-like (RecB) superfamily
MMNKDSSINHQINNLKVIISFSHYLGWNKSFKDICDKEQILEFLDIKKKTLEDDLEKNGSPLGTIT